MKLTQH